MIGHLFKIKINIFVLLQTNSGVVFQSNKGTVEEDYLDGGRGYQVIFRSRTR